MQVLIPMSGQGLRFKNAGYISPKPLIPVNGVPMIERLLEKFPQEWPCTFVVSDLHEQTELKNILKVLRPQAQIISIPQNNLGPAIAIEAALPQLHPNLPVLVTYCDYGLKWDAWDFANFVQKTDCDACVVSYRGFHAHYLSPLMYAYSRMDQERVVEIKEKGSFTEQRENEYASCGAYYFKKVSSLKEAIAYQKKNNLSVNGEFYTSLTVEALLQLEPSTYCRIYEIDAFYQWGTPLDLQNFEYWENTFTNWNRFLPKTEVLFNQLLMPMAGLGRRLAEIFTLPKPLIPVGQQAMYQHALSSFGPVKKVIFVTLESIAAQMTLKKNENLVTTKETPAGQALTTELGLVALNDTQDVIVTACDHSVVIDPELWQDFIANPKCDAAIFTIKGFPGTRRSPFSFSYIESETISDRGYFPRVLKVSVKQPLSGDSGKDSLLVGSFWFKNPLLLEQGLKALKNKNVQVNGELYLDSIFNLFIEMGLTVREFPLSGYANWGDEESLKESAYWYEIFMGQKLIPKSPWPSAL